MIHYSGKLKHVDGSHDLEVELDGNQAVIRFGASFTLRLNEGQLVNLGQVIESATRELCIKRRNTVFNESDEISLEDLEAAEEMYHAVNNVMDKMTDQMMKGPTTTVVEEKIEDWNPNDPSNW